ncbi:YihY family inner membrane protein [Polynucleobacter sp. 30F-ANTBAC]|uniref:YihY family inner membrane protein n=1 Tax=Polynucleobacter sp. 30F-ANTBAC TaxID=2689095 RepID=UPI001C0E148F|nr:YihY family inner membrane protein [Polynucleobacter sp. 30F-ANTBAC]
MQVIRHKDSILDFFSYMRQRAKVGRINEMAASLSFTTILSIVPMVTVSFALLAVMPGFLSLRRSFQNWLSVNLIPGNIGDPILVYLNQFALKAKGLTIFGSVGLIIGIFFTLITVENAFNRIWNVQNPRPFFKRIGIHLVATGLGPLLLGLSIYLSSMILSASKGWIGPLSLGFNFVAAVFPIILSILSFLLVYKILPYEKVKWSDALWGAAWAGMVFETAKFGFAWFAANFPIYKTVYGAFAILPLFLVWIYVTWWVTLAGATIVANMPIVRAWERSK